MTCCSELLAYCTIAQDCCYSRNALHGQQCWETGNTLRVWRAQLSVATQLVDDHTLVSD